MKALSDLTPGRPRRTLGAALLRLCLLVPALTLSLAAGAADSARTFATPEEAVVALAGAVKAQDWDALRSLFGPALAGIANPDRVQATNEFGIFAAALDKKHGIIRQSESKCILELGDDAWPFPVPLVRKDGRWFFDTVAGAEEVLNRRIGRNELAVLRVMRAYVEAQREYATRDRDGDEVLEYAQRLASSRGAQDGLFWSPEPNGEISPLGPMVAEAQVEGYGLEREDGSTERAPFHGYYFKILARQGKHAPGGEHDYVINGNMIGGFALVAWPAEHGVSGVMTFIVNQQGRVYQRDLGEKTSPVVRRMTAYDPNPAWRVSPD